MFLENKQWQFYTYMRREDQSDADLVPSKGAIRNVMIDDPLAFKGTREIEWRYHSRNECAQLVTTAAPRYWDLSCPN